jgi:SprT protein
MNLTNQIIGRVEDKVIETLLQAQVLYGRAFELPSIEWNLRGVCAGIAHVGENRIQLNPVLLSENIECFIA